jgi:hypothetical protein
MEFQLDEAVTILRATPRVLTAWLGDLPEPWIRCDEGDATWSPFDVVGHLIHGEETDWIPRARIILEHGEARPFTPFDRFAHMERLRGKTMGELLATFAHLRTESLATLAAWNLVEAGLGKTGRHPEFGPVTLGQLLATWTAHDLSHVAQIARVMSRRYTREVGPWRAYLPILQWPGAE